MLNLTDIGANLTHDSFDRDRAEVLAARPAMLASATSLSPGTSAAGQRCRCSPSPQQHPGYAHGDGRRASRITPVSLTRQRTERACTAGRAFRSGCRGRNGPGLFPQLFQLTTGADGVPFAAQLAACGRHVRLPVFLHQRDAHDDFMGNSGAVSEEISSAG